jgi:cytosine/adenosine deaminase-related metal-dependent hydrolase
LAEWLIRIIRHNALPQEELEARVREGVAIGVHQCLSFGVSTVGDISRHCRLTRRLLARSPLRVISYGEFQAMGQRRVLLEERLAIAADLNDAAPNVRIGISPHAPYSVEPHGYKRALEVAREKNLPLCTHLAESPDEALFLERHVGSLRKIWDFVGGWDNAVPTFKGVPIMGTTRRSPITYVESLGLLDYPTVFAHVNYIDSIDMFKIGESKASVVYCPRTHAYFRHPPHGWADMAASVKLGVGTDSTASSGDLNLVEELRLMYKIAPDSREEYFWELATIGGATALGVEGMVGSLTPGKYADYVVFPAKGDRPLVTILKEPILPTALYIGGSRVSP